VNEWQPIETAPKDGTKILGYGKWCCADTRSADTIMFICDEWQGAIDGNEHKFTPTHWMPYPEPPK